MHAGGARGFGLTNFVAPLAQGAFVRQIKFSLWTDGRGRHDHPSDAAGGCLALLPLF